MPVQGPFIRGSAGWNRSLPPQNHALRLLASAFLQIGIHPLEAVTADAVALGDIPQAFAGWLKYIRMPGSTSSEGSCATCVTSDSLAS